MVLGAVRGGFDGAAVSAVSVPLGLAEPSAERVDEGADELNAGSTDKVVLEDALGVASRRAVADADAGGLAPGSSA